MSQSSHNATSKVGAGNALRYALDGHFLALFAVLVVGWILVVFGSRMAFSAFASSGITLLGVVLSFVGAVSFLAAFVAVLYKTIVDARNAVVGET